MAEKTDSSSKKIIVEGDTSDEIPIKVIGMILLSCFLDWLSYRLSSLTKIYPLSRYLWWYSFHYRFHEENIVRDLIQEKAFYYHMYTHIYLIESDQYFVHAFIQVFRNHNSSSREILRALKREVGKSNLYISKFNKSIYKLDFVKESLSEKMLLHRKLIPF